MKIIKINPKSSYFKSQPLYQRYGSVLPTSLTYITLYNYRLLILGTCCGFWYGLCSKKDKIINKLIILKKQFKKIFKDGLKFDLQQLVLLLLRFRISVYISDLTNSIDTFRTFKKKSPKPVKKWENLPRYLSAIIFI